MEELSITQKIYDVDFNKATQGKFSGPLSLNFQNSQIIISFKSSDKATHDKVAAELKAVLEKYL